MATFSNGESGLSVRNKINEAINKVDGAAAISSINIDGGTIDGTVIGGNTPAAGTFTAVGADALDLDAIAATKAVTAVDVFVYDTSKDSDGGAWRKRTQHTSWYNETLNTATRGSRREFPAVAVIVAEADKVTIYDGDDPSLPMWMVFNTGSSWTTFVSGVSSSGSINAVYLKNGQLVVGKGYGGFICDFIKDKATIMYTAGGSNFSPDTIISRNSTSSNGTGMIIVAGNPVNDVAMTVLPDAPIDPATGLPVPTIAVATDGNGTYSTSVITDSGAVYDIASDSTGTAVSVALDGVSLSVVRSDGTVYVWDNVGTVTADGVSPDATYSASSTPALLGTVSKVAA